MSYRIKVIIPKESARYLGSKYYPLAEEFIRSEIAKCARDNLNDIRRGDTLSVQLEIHWTWSV